MKNLIIFALAALIFTATPAIAKDSNKYIYDPAHTQIIFSVSHLDFSFSHGKFNKFSGGFTFDSEAVEKSTIDVTIETNSLDMSSDDWEKHLKNADFLNVEKFPTMTFKSTKVEKTGEKTGKVTGDLTIMGIIKPATLDVTWNKSGIHPYSKNFVAGFTASGKIKRSDFGMSYGLPGIGDEVNLNIQVEGIRQDFEGLDKK